MIPHDSFYNIIRHFEINNTLRISFGRRVTESSHRASRLGNWVQRPVRSLSPFAFLIIFRLYLPSIVLKHISRSYHGFIKAVPQCLQNFHSDLTIPLQDGHSRFLSGISLTGGNRIIMTMGSQKKALRKNHPTGLRPLLLAISAPTVPGIPHIINRISTLLPKPNIFSSSFNYTRNKRPLTKFYWIFYLRQGIPFLRWVIDNNLLPHI
jgi:hypothetical protein